MKSDISFVSKCAAVFFFGIVFLMLVVAAYSIILNLTLAKAKPEIDRVINFEEQINNCKVHYDNLDYEGNCDAELLERIGNIIGFDKKLELSKFCSTTPRAYQMELCNDLG